MKCHNLAGLWCALAMVIWVLSPPCHGWGTSVSHPMAGAQQQRTSENTPLLKKLLERRPEADLDKDGILTMEEAQKARRQMQDARRDQGGSRSAGARGPRKPAPTQADVSYGDYERNVLDFWQAESDTPTPLFVWIHGGGFRGGDKASIPAELLESCLKAGISCASINYRLSDQAPYPAQMHDSARAIQFLRLKAAEWKLDPKRFAAGGGSAGSGISQWIAFHDDMAQPDSRDPVARQSTRLSCVLPINMQSTYDPRQIKRLIPGEAYKHPALLPLFARPRDWDWDTDEIDDALDAMLKDASPINHLSADDPPVFLIHYERSNKPGNIHHSNFGKHLKGAMDELGIECVRRMDTDYDSMTAAYADMVEFLKRQFGMRKEAK